MFWHLLYLKIHLDGNPVTVTLWFHSEHHTVFATCAHSDSPTLNAFFCICIIASYSFWHCYTLIVASVAQTDDTVNDLSTFSTTAISQPCSFTSVEAFWLRVFLFLSFPSPCPAVLFSALTAPLSPPSLPHCHHLSIPALPVSPCWFASVWEISHDSFWSHKISE